MGKDWSKILVKKMLPNMTASGRPMPTNMYEMMMTGTCKAGLSAPYLHTTPPPAAIVSAAITGSMTAGGTESVPGDSSLVKT